MANFEEVRVELTNKKPNKLKSAAKIKQGRYYPANICLDEDVLKTSYVFVFRRLLQDVLIKTNISTLVIRLQKMSSRRLDQYEFIRLDQDE